jgi:hypothetical protein
VVLRLIQMSADEEMTQRSDDAHMVDEPTNEALEPISTPSQSQPSSPPPPPAPSSRKRYRKTAPAAVERSLASVVQQVAEGDTTIDNEEEAKEKGEEEGMSQNHSYTRHSLPSLMHLPISLSECEPTRSLNIWCNHSRHCAAQDC